MGQCKQCGRRRFLRGFPRRLDLPEMRALVSHWPWHKVQVCPECRPAFDAEFRRRIALMGPQAVAEEGDVTTAVCLFCGTQEADAGYEPAARWVDAAGALLAMRFMVCGACRGKTIANGIVSAGELRETKDFQTLLAALPEVTDDLVRRTEGWSPAAGPGPDGAAEVRRGLDVIQAAVAADTFWQKPPGELASLPGPPIRGAMLQPEKNNAIRTHLVLEWRTSQTERPEAVSLSVYRMGSGFVLVRGTAKPV
jgi:hypothetical protein